MGTEVIQDAVENYYYQGGVKMSVTCCQRVDGKPRAPALSRVIFVLGENMHRAHIQSYKHDIPFKSKEI